MTIKVKKSLRNNIVGSLLLGSSIAIVMQVQASQQALSRAERERREIRENDKRAAEAAEKMSGLNKEEWAAMTLEEQKKFMKANANRREKKKRNDKFWKSIDDKKRINITSK
jgi:hypothetical protein